MDTAYIHDDHYADFEEYRQHLAPRLGSAPQQCVVVFKDPVNWLESIAHWGVRCGWVGTESEVFSGEVWRLWLEEYLHYYGAWAGYASARCDQVHLVQYEAMVLRPEPTMEALSNFLKRPLSDGARANTSRVAQSSERDAARLRDDVLSTALPPELVGEIYATAQGFNVGTWYHTDPG